MSLPVAAPSQTERSFLQKMKTTGFSWAASAREKASPWIASAWKASAAFGQTIAKKAQAAANQAKSTQWVLLNSPNINPAFTENDPKGTLQSITLKTTKIFDGLKGLDIPPKEPEIQQSAPPRAPSPPAISESQPASQPRPPSEIYKRQDWKKRIEKTTDTLSTKLGQFGVLWLMKTRACGIETQNHSDLLHLICQHEEGVYSSEGYHSLWTLFTNEYKLNWTQLSWWKAGFIYFWGYSFTSLAPKITHAYLNGIINGVREEFSQTSPKYNLKNILSNTLNHSEQFLRNCRPAATEFFKNKGEKSFWQYLLENESHRDPSELYRDFSRAIIERYPVKISFFEKAREIPYLGRVFSTFPFTWLENKMNRAVRYVVQEWILPPSLKSAITGGVDAANTLSFKIQLTNFIKDRLTKFKGQFDPMTKKPKNPNPPKAKQLEGTEKLPQVINLLIDSSMLMPGKDQFQRIPGIEEEIDKRRAEKPDEKSIESQIYDGIEGGLCDGAHVFFNHLADNSDEILSELWALSETFFKDPLARRAYIQEDYDEARKIMRAEARDVFDLIIPYAVNKKMEEEAKSAESVAQEIFKQEKTETTGNLSILKSLFDEISNLINRNESNIQKEIGAVAKILASFAERAKNQIPEDLTSAEKKALELAFAPIYDITDKLAEEAFNLHLNAHNHDSYSRANESLNKILNQLGKLDSNPDSDFQEARKSILEERNKIYFAFQREEVGSKNIRETTLIDNGLNALSPIFKELSTIQNRISQVDDLYSDKGEEKPFNLLIKSVSSNNKRNQRSAVNSIRKILESIPAEDHNSLGKAIDEFIKNQSEEKKQEAIQLILKTKKNYTLAKTKKSDQAKQEIGQFTGSLQTISEDYQKGLASALNQLQAYQVAAKKHLEALENSLSNIESKPEVRQLHPSVATAAIGGIVGLFLGPAAAAFVGIGAYMSIQNLSGITNKKVSTIAKTSLTAAAAAAVVSFSPFPYPALQAVGLGSAVTGIAGANLLHGAKKLGEEEIRRSVDSLFNNSCDLIFEPTTIHAAITRFMVQMSARES